MGKKRDKKARKSMSSSQQNFVNDDNAAHSLSEGCIPHSNEATLDDIQQSNEYGLDSNIPQSNGNMSDGHFNISPQLLVHVPASRNKVSHENATEASASVQNMGVRTRSMGMMSTVSTVVSPVVTSVVHGSNANMGTLSCGTQTHSQIPTVSRSNMRTFQPAPTQSNMLDMRPMYQCSRKLDGVSNLLAKQQEQMTELLQTMKVVVSCLTDKFSLGATNVLENKGRTRERTVSITSESDARVSVSDSDIESDSQVYQAKSKRQRFKTSSLKLPPFDGDESWKIWKNRFLEIAERRKWSESTKLDVLLQRMQGVAGEFVFGELSRATRQNFSKLVTELDSRFLVVETKRSYAAKFNNRNQKTGESIEQYAAELKKLYSKAYPKRDVTTRNEDLVRKFLDGLLDDEAQFQVEFGKCPETIDEAVSEVVNFMETRKGRRDRKVLRQVTLSSSETENESEVGGAKRKKKNSRKKWNRVRVKINSLEERVQKLTQQVEASQVQTKFDSVNNAQNMGKTAPIASGILPMFTRPPPVVKPGETIPDFRGMCYNCHQQGHFARECPLKMQLPQISAHVGPLNVKGSHL